MRWQLRSSEDHSGSGALSKEITRTLIVRGNRRNSRDPNSWGTVFLFMCLLIVRLGEVHLNMEDFPLRGTHWRLYPVALLQRKLANVEL